VVSLLRFAVKATRKSDIQPVKALPNQTAKVDITEALNVLRTSQSVEGMPEDIDKIPCELDYPSVRLDGTGWAGFESEVEKQLQNAPWKCVTLRATALSPSNEPRNFTLNDEASGWNGICRPRVLTVAWPDPISQETRLSSWELDSLNIEERARLFEVCLTQVVIGYDLVVTLNWLSHEHARITGELPDFPDRTIDIGLAGRILRPSVPMELQVKANKDDGAKDIVAQGGSGWTLEALSSVVLNAPVVSYTPTVSREWAAPAPLSDDLREEVEAQTTMVMRVLQGLLKVDESMDLLDAWDNHVMAQSRSDVAHLHYIQHYPQVLSAMHLKGMPFSQASYKEYVQTLEANLETLVHDLIAAAPELQEFEGDFLDPSKGLSERLKHAIGKAFTDRGLTLDHSKGKGRLPKIGEKELRGAGATRNEQTRPIFESLIAIGKNKRQTEMAHNLSGFAERSHDGRLHSVFQATTGTMRLVSTEPNCQQMPGVQSFRNLIEADEGHQMVSYDFSALDVRNGAALAIRAQRRWVEALKTGNLNQLTHDPEMIKALDEALSSQNPKIELMALERNMHRLQEKARQSGAWQEYETAQKRQIAHRAAVAWLAIKPHTEGSEDGCWGGLREAFQLNADVHAYTGLRFTGKDPKSLITTELGDKPSQDALKAWWDKMAGELGPVRRRGKIANLSLLYAMTLEGFQKDAAQKFDEHWSLKETQTYYNGWYQTFPEIDLMNCMMAMQAITHGSDKNRLMGYRFKDEGRYGRKALTMFKCRTLADRILYAEGINAGLNYGNQGTGADVLMRVMVDLRLNYRPVFNCLVNQVHDELVSMMPNAKLEEFKDIKETVLLQHAAEMTEPFGVPMDISCTVGDVWIKD